MNDLIEFFTSKEIIVVYIVFGVACLLCFLVYLLDKSYYKRRRKQNTKELNKLVEQVNEKMNGDHTGTTNVVANQMVDAVSISKPQVAAVDMPVVVSSEALNSPSSTAENVVPEVINLQEVKTVNNEVIVENIEKKADEVVQQEEKIENLVLDSMLEDNSVDEEENVTLDTLTDDKTDDLIYAPIEPDQTEAQAELQKLTEELQKAEEVTSNISLTSFEEQQEQEAIISLDELLKKSSEMYQENEISQYADEGNEPISIADLEKRYKEEKSTITSIDNVEKPEAVLEPVEVLTVENTQPVEFVQEKLVLEDFNSVKVPLEVPLETTKVSSWSEEKKFKKSPVISPIFGIESKEVNTEMELENTANYEKLDEEIKKTNEFIMTLKELQKKLN